MAAHWVHLLVFASVLAGCIDKLPAPTDEPVPEVGATLELTVTGRDGGEPMIGMLRDGTRFVTADGDVVREDDDGWTVVRSADNLDPILWVDAEEDLVIHPVWQGTSCVTASFSDDRGATWETAQPACAHGIIDQPKFVTGPAPGGGRAWHTCMVTLQGTSCLSSTDRGSTWMNQVPAMTHGVDTPCDDGPAHELLGKGQIGQPMVDDAGVLLLAKTSACPELVVASTEDLGRTWTVEQTGLPSAPDNANPALAPLGDSVAVLYHAPDGHARLATRQEGGSWTDLVDVTPPGVETTVFTALGSWDGKTLVGGFLGSSVKAPPSHAPADAVWHLYLFTYDGTLTVHQATADPVQVGCVWLEGGSSPCRNMLDFFHGVASQGRFDLAFSDGCTGRCAEEPSAARSTNRAVTVASIVLPPS